MIKTRNFTKRIEKLLKNVSKNEGCVENALEDHISNENDLLLKLASRNKNSTLTSYSDFYEIYKNALEKAMNTFDLEMKKSLKFKKELSFSFPPIIQHFEIDDDFIDDDSVSDSNETWEADNDNHFDSDDDDYLSESEDCCESENEDNKDCLNKDLILICEIDCCERENRKRKQSDESLLNFKKLFVK